MSYFKFYYIRGAFNKFTDVFAQVFKIVVDSWKFTMYIEHIAIHVYWTYCYTSYEMTDQFLWSHVQMNSYSMKLEYTLRKPDCHSWGISKMQSGREDTLEERYAIKFYFKHLGKMPQKRMECFRLLFNHLAWIKHQFLSGIRDSRKAGSVWGMMRGVGGVRKSIHQSWLAKVLGLRFGLLCWGFKGVQEDIPSEVASSLQIGSVAFPPGQYTSPQLHSCHRLFEQDGHQDSFSASL